MVVTMVIGMVLSLRFWCNKLISGGMARLREVPGLGLARLAWLKRTRACKIKYGQSLCDTYHVLCKWGVRMIMANLCEVMVLVRGTKCTIERYT
jgi:hypothetical protein